MISVEVRALDYMSVLGQEITLGYTAESKTVSQIVSDLLAFQVRTPAVTVGTIDGSISGLTRSMQSDGDSILSALFKLRDTCGGYIEVDNDLQLNWYASIGEDKGQQIRYRKNMSGIVRHIDYTRLVNRVYAYGEGEGDARIKISDADGYANDYIENTDSQTEWNGIYPRPFRDPTITHPDTLVAWAEQLLAEHKDPPISYAVPDTVDLGQDIDWEALQLGSTVTVIDEDLGINISVSVVRIEHPDLSQPHRMEIELANRVKDITDTLTEIYGQQQFEGHIATKIGAGQVIVKGTFTVLDWATDGTTEIDGGNITTSTVTLDTINFVPLVSTSGTGDIVATINASTEGLTIDADKISVNVGKSIFKQDAIPTSVHEGDLWFDTDDNNKLYRAASVGADEITAGEWELVRDEQIDTNSANITINADDISFNVTSINNLDGRVTTNESDISQNAYDITLKVSETDYDGETICSKINLTSSSITIEAKHIEISGDCHFSSDDYNPSKKIDDGGAATDINTHGTTIDGGKITTDTIAANKLTTSTLTGRTITLDGSTAIIKSSNYSAGSAGWQIEGDGNAEFNNVHVRGSIYASTIESGELITVDGELRVGDSGTPGTDFTGLRFYKSGTTYRMEGQNSGTLEAYFDSDGKLKAGGGNVILDQNGIQIYGDILTMYDINDIERGGLYGHGGGNLLMWAPSGTAIHITAGANSNVEITGYADVELTASNDINLIPIGKVNASGDIDPSIGETYKLGDSTYDWDAIYGHVIFADDGEIHSYEGHDDLAILKGLQMTPNRQGRMGLDARSLPLDAYSEGPTGKRHVNLAALQGLNFGIARALLDRIDALTTQVDKLQSEVQTLRHA